MSIVQRLGPWAPMRLEKFSAAIGSALAQQAQHSGDKMYSLTIVHPAQLRGRRGTGPRKATVEFVGDNQCVVLYDETGQVISAASYWNTNSSLAGVGQVLFLITREDGVPTGRIFTDNHRLVDFFTGFNKHFLGFENIAWNVVPEVSHMQIMRSDGEFTLQCDHSQSGSTIAVSWRDLATPYICRAVKDNFGNELGRRYEVSCAIISARLGTIHINGAALPGAVGPYGALPRSAFLAFCGTWTRVSEDHDRYT